MTPLQVKIVDALKASPGFQMSYHDLGRHLWPHDQFPKAWRYSSNGGPPGWAMSLGRALRQLRQAGIAYQKQNHGAGQGDVVLMPPIQ